MFLSYLFLYRCSEWSFTLQFTRYRFAHTTSGLQFHPVYLKGKKKCIENKCPGFQHVFVGGKFCIVFFFSLSVEMKVIKWGNTNSYLFSQGRLLQWNVSILVSNSVYLILSVTKETSCLHQGVSFARCFSSQTQQSLHMHLQLQISKQIPGDFSGRIFSFTHLCKALLNSSQSAECLADPSTTFFTL